MNWGEFFTIIAQVSIAIVITFAVVFFGSAAVVAIYDVIRRNK